MLESYTKFDGETSTGWHLVATQDWVSQVIVSALNRRIKDVNNLASSALSRAGTAIKKANDAISDILTWCSTWNGVSFVSRVALEQQNLAKAIFYYTRTVTANTDNKGHLTGTVSVSEEEQTRASWAIWAPTLACNSGTYTLTNCNYTITWDNTSIQGALNALGTGSTKIDEAIGTIQKEIDSLKTQMSGATFTFEGTESTVSVSGTAKGDKHRHSAPAEGDKYTGYTTPDSTDVSASGKFTPKGTIKVTWGSASAT